MTFEQEVKNLIDLMISGGTLLNGNLTGIDETHKTAIAIVYMIDVPTDKVVEQYFYVWKSGNDILYKGMDRLPSRF